MATVPVIRTFVAGEIVLASYFNTNINGPISFLLAPPIFRGRQTTLQTLTTATFTAITMTTEDVDSAGGHSTSSNTSRYTFQYAGWHDVSGGVGFASNATGYRAADLRVNGTAVNGTQSNIPALNSSISNVVLGTELIFGNVTDYVEMFALQASGGNLDTSVGGVVTVQPRMNVRWRSN